MTPSDGMHKLWALIGVENHEVRRARIATLGDDVLLSYYLLLSDEALIVNVPVLDDLRAEIERRKLPMPTQRH